MSLVNALARIAMKSTYLSRRPISPFSGALTVPMHRIIDPFCVSKRRIIILTY